MRYNFLLLASIAALQLCHSYALPLSDLVVRRNSIRERNNHLDPLPRYTETEKKDTSSSRTSTNTKDLIYEGSRSEFATDTTQQRGPYWHKKSLWTLAQ